MAKARYTTAKLIASAATTLLIVIALSKNWGDLPPFGTLLDPFQGCWQNAEPKQALENSLALPDLNEPVKVLYDANRSPHIFANTEHDLYYVQGYLTARDRLWQMELQTHAAAGRVSEILGSKAIAFDRKQRRKGMVLAAQRSLTAINANPISKNMVQSYADGVNAYISQLSHKQLPLEYKLLNYQPEAWTTLKTALLLKIMADDLSGYSNDVAYTNALTQFGRTTFDKMFPDFQDYISPIIPRGTPFDFTGDLNDTITPKVDTTQFLHSVANVILPSTHRLYSTKPEMPIGSNNWAVGPSKTKDGYPILCGDPHLKLSLPSIWYEIQLTLNGKSVNGASLPGAPGIIIGFNDSCAWSMTNAERDVRDFYTIKFKDATQKEYWLDGRWQKTTQTIETLLVRNHSPVYDTVFTTQFGIVVYDKSFHEEGQPKNTAVDWIAQRASNEVMTIYLLNKAANYADYAKALTWYQSPAQNFVFACKNKDIAIWQQGCFPIKFYEQGKFIQPGDNSKLTWHKFIPTNENPHILNPERGFVSSANQQPTDSTYPYYYYGDYYEYRSLRINKVLENATNITIEDMKHLQHDNYNLWVEDFKNQLSVLFPNQKLGKTIFTIPGKTAFTTDLFTGWNMENTAQNPYTAFYRIWYENLAELVFGDEFSKAKVRLDLPNRDVFIKKIMTDSTFALTDNCTTKQIETMPQLVIESFAATVKKYDSLVQKGQEKWADYRHSQIGHLAKLDAFSVPISGDGEGNSVNALTGDHGPSWKMVVELKPETEAYGIFPGGQSGNPGSYYYDNRISKWDKGEYDRLYVFKPTDDAKASAIQLFTKK